MDQIEAFLEALLENSPKQYKSIAQKAIDIYQGRGELTVNLKEWALKAAKVQGVVVPDAFLSISVFQPKSRTHTLEDGATPSDAPVLARGCSTDLGDREIVAETMATIAQLLALAAERLRRQ
ncbi:hypothetical protein E2C06_08005 [Dankookia rubra]|uniref:Uncharacterized protein n=1 Tax=Dankookia rubra TaxID=1442381 RepID=A0A4R5QJQ1_9PROT|nr:hypothetical protein [Dankookia rubra]TDH63303.1 hypothetical protein E2C06_08005 [Dankookia rubra]